MEERVFQPALFYFFCLHWQGNVCRKFRIVSFSKIPLFGCEFWNNEFNHMHWSFCVVCVSDLPEMWASSGVLGAISPLPLSSLAASAKSLLQDSGLSDQHRNQHNGEESLGDFAQAAMASTRLIEHKVSAATSAQRARAAQRMARQLWGDTLSSWRHESWQSLMPTVTSAQTVEYASFLSC